MENNKIIDEKLKDYQGLFNTKRLINPDKYINNLLKDKTFINNLTTRRKSDSAKIAWMRYRVNYGIGNKREQIREYLGLPKIQDSESFDYIKLEN